MCHSVDDDNSGEHSAWCLGSVRALLSRAKKRRAAILTCRDLDVIRATLPPPLSLPVTRGRTCDLGVAGELEFGEFAMLMGVLGSDRPVRRLFLALLRVGRR